MPLVETGGFSTGFSELLAGVLLDGVLLAGVLLEAVLLDGLMLEVVLLDDELLEVVLLEVVVLAGASEVVVLAAELLVSSLLLTTGVPSGEIIIWCEVLEYVDEPPCGLELPPLSAEEAPCC